MSERTTTRGLPRLEGRIITPDDGDYEETRTVFSGEFDRKPAFIARVVNDTDVARVIEHARRTGMELAIRSGGHSFAGHSSTDGGIVLDLRERKGLEFDAEQRTAWAETGLTSGEVTTAVQARDLVVGFGDTPSVGIGGLTLGGGIGYLVRKHGLTIDSLLAADVVTAGGELVRADSENHPDLFWAIRGGGGNFGVATRFQFRLHDLGPVVGGMLVLPAAADVIAGFVAAADAAPEELSAIANIMPAPPMPFLPEEQQGRLIVMATIVWAGEAEAGERALAPFRALATPIADMVRPMRYAEVFPPDDDSYHPTSVSTTMYLKTVDHAAAEKIVHYLETSDASLPVAQLRVLGGAMARVPSESTAFAHRTSRLMANLAAFYEGPEDKLIQQAWLAELASALPRTDGAYVNFLRDEGQARVHEAYPSATWERLAEVKRRYDPNNLFRLNQNVEPG